MNFMDPHSWFQQEEEKRKNRMRANDISLINRQLQQLLHEVQHKIDDWKKYEKVANRLEHEHSVSQCSLWNLSWANNFESERVALAQGLLIHHILKNETFEKEAYLLDQAHTLMRRLGNVAWETYVQFGQLKDRT